MRRMSRACTSASLRSQSPASFTSRACTSALCGQGSAAFVSLWLFLAMPYGHPATKAIIGLPAPWVRAIAVAFCAAVPLQSFVTGFNPFGVNPLVATAPPAPSASAEKKKK